MSSKIYFIRPSTLPVGAAVIRNSSRCSSHSKILLILYDPAVRGVVYPFPVLIHKHTPQHTADEIPRSMLS